MTSPQIKQRMLIEEFDFKFEDIPFPVCWQQRCIDFEVFAYYPLLNDSCWAAVLNYDQSRAFARVC